MLASLLPASAGIATAATAYKPPASRTVLFASDGMRPDLMEKYAGQGLMPNYQLLMQKGVRGDNGMVQAFPPNTGVGWYTMATGTYPGEHGSTNNTYFRMGDVFSNRTSFAGAGSLQADTIASAAERSGKKVAQVDWVGGAQANIAGPTVDFASFFSTRGVLAAPLDPTEQTQAGVFGISYQLAAFSAASGWTNQPTQDPAAPPQQSVLTVLSTSGSYATHTYDVYVYDSVLNGTAAYDRVLLVESAPVNDAKDASKARANLTQGAWQNIRVDLSGPRAGQGAGFYTKLIALAGDLSSFKLYFTSVERVIATCSTAACNALPAGAAGENRLEKYLNDHFPTAVAADFAPIEAGIIDEDTYVEQGLDREGEYADAVLEYILGTLQPDTELAMVGFPVTDEFSHQFMGLYTPTDMDGDPNPYYDNLDGTGATDGRTAIREGYVRSAYHGADTKLGIARSLMGGSPTTVAASDHGFAAQWWAVNAQKILQDTTVHNTSTNTDQSVHASSGNASNCGAATTDYAKACWAGGTIQIYVNSTLPAGVTYAAVRTAIVNRFTGYTDPNNGGKLVVSRVMLKEELRNVDGSDSLHPSRSGDVVVVLRPPYQSDAGTNNVAIAFSQFFGQHGYLPELVDIAHNINMHATFVASGPGIQHLVSPLKKMRAIDIAPTLSFLMGFPGPQNSRGKIRYDLFPTRASSLREATILDISDWHGQLIPLSEAADTVSGTGTSNPSFNIGGSAFLKPWFDWYRGEARNGSLSMAAGDTIGATPPISNYFGDIPAIKAMRMMGMQLDGIGNHNFDAGQAYFRQTIIPYASQPSTSEETSFRFLSSNLISSLTGRLPKQWQASLVFDFGGARIGFVGFSNDDIPELTSPAKLAPIVVTDPIAAVNAEANRIAPISDGVVAFGHYGATSSTLTAPSGPLINLADNVRNVNTVIGDHTNFQVLSSRPNRVLTTENLSKGVRFTRVRLVVDMSLHKVIYQTADWHKPFDIGVTPDPDIQAYINDLNAQVAPIFNTIVGQSTTFIPRSDACGRVDGRLCESRVGNIVTDSMRERYAGSPIDTEFAVTNSGGLRADLTCPAVDNASDFCPAYGSPPPPYNITRGQVNTVLPFGNQVVTLDVNGAELKAMLENGVSLIGSSTGPSAQGRFPQVSGLCFTYDITQDAGNRVTSVVRANTDGTCTATAVDLTTASTYHIAENDFMLGGGDGYPDFRSGHNAATQDLMDQVLADYIAAHSPVGPTIQGRIRCTEGAGPNPAFHCPVITAP